MKLFTCYNQSKNKITKQVEKWVFSFISVLKYMELNFCLCIILLIIHCLQHSRTIYQNINVVEPRFLNEIKCKSIQVLAKLELKCIKTDHIKLLFEFCCSVVYYYKIKLYKICFLFHIFSAPRTISCSCSVTGLFCTLWWCRRMELWMTQIIMDFKFKNSRWGIRYTLREKVMYSTKFFMWNWSIL